MVCSQHRYPCDRMPATSSSNTTLISSYEDLFYFCWNGQSCSSCHNQEYSPSTISSMTSMSNPIHNNLIPRHPCVFCPFSGTCVPNLHSPQLLSPIWRKDICPYSSERFELRSHGMGCGVSTATFLSVVISVLGTLTSILLCWVLVHVVRLLRHYWEQHRGKIVWPQWLDLRSAKRWQWVRYLPYRSSSPPSSERVEPPSERASLLENTDGRGR